MNSAASSPGEVPAATATTPPVEPPVLDSVQLLGGRKQIAILHDGETYSLRLTRNGKLILTK
ncbi:MAG: hemin uptake protein HemP [Methyloversatilis sp.]|jgi:hemin uptake protein HemP|nr:hemin uptake protein HemP [Methyloversatilis sp.]MBP6194761.1 hemin uptake protein HemP [Methyloversatilis sp.]MBP9118335.1 hemin uptake protein HemP [Methyloversatilis sp.]